MRIANSDKILAIFLICSLSLVFGASLLFAQQNEEVEFSLDVNAATVALPKIFKPNIDMSGRGFNRQKSWPQGLAAPEVIDIWQRDIGFPGFYRLQYNLWEIHELAKDRPAQQELLRNYESIIKRINDAGGIVILDFFGTPAGLGKVLDKKSPPVDPKVFKELVKNQIRIFSCEKKYAVWYEVWSAPDVDEFFLGKKQEYLNLYRAVAEGIKELESETKIHIPLGGPSVTWWFQDLDGNTIVNPERSLIYELIRFCYRWRLPLDFISWHAYSTDPKAEQDMTVYKKSGIGLIRDWLSYFRFSKDTPFIVDEWNFDSGNNLSPARHEKSHISASYIPARIKAMHEAGIDNQVYFCLEDFQNNIDGVVRNTGVFWFDTESAAYKGTPKSSYNVLRMLQGLGERMWASNAKTADDFVGTIATKNKDDIVILIYNYIDPNIVNSFLSRNIGSLTDGERKILLNLIKNNKLDKLMRGESDIAKFQAPRHLKQVLAQAQELSARAAKFSLASRTVKLGIKNLKGSFNYRRFTVDSLCGLYCDYIPKEDKALELTDAYQETLTVNPYSVTMLVLRKKPPEPKKPEVTSVTAPEAAALPKEKAKEETLPTTQLPAATPATLPALPTQTGQAVAQPPEKKPSEVNKENSVPLEPAKQPEPVKQPEPAAKQADNVVTPKPAQQQQGA